LAVYLEAHRDGPGREINVRPGEPEHFTEPHAGGVTLVNVQAVSKIGPELRWDLVVREPVLDPQPTEATS